LKGEQENLLWWAILKELVTALLGKLDGKGKAGRSF
jgi:hypothetical protein